MTIKGVRAAIEKALQSPSSKPNVSVTEARAIEKAALTETRGKGKVTAGEAEELRKVLWGDAFQTAGTYHVTDAARAELESFARAQGLPIGSNASVMCQQMETALVSAPAPALAQAPSLANRMPVTLSDARPSDGALREALYDPQQRDFYLRTTVMDRASGKPVVSWSGPVSIDAKPSRDAENARIQGELRDATNGMLYTSESDYPFDVVLFAGAGAQKPSAADFLKAAGLPSDTPVETRTEDDWFNPLIHDQDPNDPASAQSEARYQSLRDALDRDLTDVQVFRTGSIQIGVWVVGRNAYGDLVGVHTTSIET